MLQSQISYSHVYLTLRQNLCYIKWIYMLGASIFNATNERIEIVLFPLLVTGSVFSSEETVSALSKLSYFIFHDYNFMCMFDY